MTSWNRVAIIGGGVSGLAVAYHLITRPDAPGDLDVVIFERGKTLGGNADTVGVRLGKNYADPDRPDYERWADLAVNDFNKTSYKQMMAAMTRIGFGEDRYKPLEDTICFFTLDGSILYTEDDYFRPSGEDRRRIVDERFHMRRELAEANQRFMKTAAEDVTERRGEFKSMTVAAYVDDYVEKHKPQEKLIREMAAHLLYPRIAAMYFVDERGPERMPIVAVMDYYILQENFPEVDKAERMYFDGGSQEWINHLHEWLEGQHRSSADSGLPRVATRYDFPAKVLADEGGVRVHRADERGLLCNDAAEHFDKVVFACYADDALRSFGPQGMTDEIAAMLGKVSHTNSIAICHTFSGVLPPNRDSWRTYNVMIRDGAAMTPYSMTYVINRHQNDAENPAYQEAGLPQYFVTLNPAIRIPDRFVLPTTQDSGIARAERAPGYLTSGPLGKGEHPDPAKAIGWFKHNVVDFACLEAQDMLPGLQGGAFGNVYFAGGWTNGAGLHEQCWRQGERVVAAICG